MLAHHHQGSLSLSSTFLSPRFFLLPLWGIFNNISLSPLSASSAASTLSISRAPSGAGADGEDAGSVVATSDEAAATTLLCLGFCVAARVVLTAAPSPLVAAGVRAPRCRCCRCCCFFGEVAAATAGAEVIVVEDEEDEEDEEADAKTTRGLLAALRATPQGATAPPRESAAEETARIARPLVGQKRGAFLWRESAVG